MEDGLIISIPVVAAGVVAAAPAGCGYCGMVVEAGAAVSIEVRDGSASGVLLDAMQTTVATDQQTYYGSAPLWCGGRPFIVVVSGTLPVMSLRYR